LRAHFGELVFKTVIPRSVKLAESPSYGEPVTAHAPASRGAQAYVALAAEIVAREAEAEARSLREQAA
jgi:chromosome partitioning protein